MENRQKAIYLCLALRLYVVLPRGAFFKAEITPVKPDADNAAVGMAGLLLGVPVLTYLQT